MDWHELRHMWRIGEKSPRQDAKDLIQAIVYHTQLPCEKGLSLRENCDLQYLNAIKNAQVCVGFILWRMSFECKFKYDILDKPLWKRDEKEVEHWQQVFEELNQLKIRGNGSV